MSEKINRQDDLIKDLISRMTIEWPESELDNEEGLYLKYSRNNCLKM